MYNPTFEDAQWEGEKFPRTAITHALRKGAAPYAFSLAT